jgi:hypothetical protein
LPRYFPTDFYPTDPQDDNENDNENDNEIDEEEEDNEENQLTNSLKGPHATQIFNHDGLPEMHEVADLHK